jgi:hypothetical protein
MIHPLFISLYRYLFFLTGILPASRIPHPASALLLLSALICPYLHLSALIYSYLPLSALICSYLPLSALISYLASRICPYLAFAPTASAIGAKTNRMRHRQYYRYSYIGCALHPETW